jgi:hypothetical protein
MCVYCEVSRCGTIPEVYVEKQHKRHIAIQLKCHLLLTVLNQTCTVCNPCVKKDRFIYSGKSLVGTDILQQKRHIDLQLECTDVSYTDVYRIRARSIGQKAEFILRPNIKYILLYAHFNKTHLVENCVAGFFVTNFTESGRDYSKIWTIWNSLD